jgi:maltose alpha-D-glucosyltransferase/alpha-amylase
MAALELGDEPSVRRLPGEQSNSSIIVGEEVVLKILRKLFSGIHPEAEMTRYLTEAGYANIAPLRGEVVRNGKDGLPVTLMLLQGFVRNQGDGWGWTLDWLARAADQTGEETDSLAGYLSFIAALGKRLGELHAVLARPSDDAAFTPEVAGEASRTAWAEGAIEQLDPALDLLAKAPLEGEDKALADSLLARRDALKAAARKLAQSADGALMTRVHGDFHLGQVLVAQGDAVIVDFEGEPARTLEERRAKGSPLRDVAGLLRSLDYAAAAAAGAQTTAPAERRDALLTRFREEASAAFLAAYREAEEASPNQWAPEETRDALIDLFLLEKASYELRYEAANRPAWLSIPLRGLAALADRLVTS